MVNNAANLYIFGGDASTADTGGQGTRLRLAARAVVGLQIHDTGSTGFAARAINGPVDHDDFQGTISKIGQNLAWDTHCVNECGTGLHGANLWDGATAGNFTNNRFAFYAHRHSDRRLRRVRQRRPDLAGNGQRPVSQVRQRDRGLAEADRRERPAAVGRHRHSGYRRQVSGGRQRPRPGTGLPGGLLGSVGCRRHRRVRRGVQYEPELASERAE